MLLVVQNATYATMACRTASSFSLFDSPATVQPQCRVRANEWCRLLHRLRHQPRSPGHDTLEDTRHTHTHTRRDESQRMPFPLRFTFTHSPIPIHLHPGWLVLEPRRWSTLRTFVLLPHILGAISIFCRYAKIVVPQASALLSTSDPSTPRRII